MLPLDIAAIAIIFVAMLFYIIYLGYTALTMAIEFWVDSNMKYNEKNEQLYTKRK